MPIHGAVEVVWDRIEEGRQNWITVAVAPLGADRKRLVHNAHDSPSGSHLFPSALPGEYEAVILKGWGVGELTERMRVSVEEGRTTRVVLRD